MKKIEKTLIDLINSIHELKDISIDSEDLTPEQLQYVQEGFVQGLCLVSLLVADELDAQTDGDSAYLEQEYRWWDEETLCDMEKDIDNEPDCDTCACECD